MGRRGSYNRYSCLEQGQLEIYHFYQKIVISATIEITLHCIRVYGKFNCIRRHIVYNYIYFFVNREKYDWIEECTTDDNKTDFASSEPLQKNQLTDKTRRDSYEHPDLRVCNQVDDTKRRDSYEQPDIRRL